MLYVTYLVVCKGRVAFMTQVSVEYTTNNKEIPFGRTKEQQANGWVYLRP